MKTNIIIVLLTVLSIFTYGCSVDDDRPGSTDKFDFRNTYWGMTHQKVKESEDGTPDNEKTEVITYSGEFEGMPAIIGYLFEDGKLVRAGYLMTESYGEPELYMKDFDSLKDYFTRTYGKPEYDMGNWREGVEPSKRPDEYLDAVCGGDLQYLAGWGTDSTMVRLKLQGNAGKCELGVMYESKQWYVTPEVKQKELDRDRSDMEQDGAKEK